MSDRDNWDAYQFDGSGNLSNRNNTRRDVAQDNYQYDGGGDPYANDRMPGRAQQRRDGGDRFVDQQRFVDGDGRTVIINNYISARNVYLNQGDGRQHSGGGYDPMQNPGCYDRNDRYRTSYYPDRQQNWGYQDNYRDPYDDPYRQQVWARQEAQRRYMDAMRRGNYDNGYDDGYYPQQYYRPTNYRGNYYNQGYGQDGEYVRARPGSFEYGQYGNNGNSRYSRVYIPDCYGNNGGYYDDGYGYNNDPISQIGRTVRALTPAMGFVIALRGGGGNHYRGY